mmetsp:Transcript_42600/g.43166  ORF Transcript_42600/g.43166 Transcript_42600/m.43166 type:complete len:80 (+) Transcript_42600:123-362(+)
MGSLVDSFVGRDIVDFDSVILLLLTYRTDRSCALLVQIEPKILWCWNLRDLTVPLEDLRQMEVLGCRFAACRRIVFSTI